LSPFLFERGAETFKRAECMRLSRANLSILNPDIVVIRDELADVLPDVMKQRAQE
jgi:hypothetical protein